ncbi:Stk1 family PASTA domain-containing Ser/Thr kinase [Peptostreptococcus equinus]|uniref:non-specific serine/threonine protein kinase n=1 Tax=Peptostreptococcus equinus TaxID=3003601 RepID=A0ABY7JLK9_9FIRM|nr:Stk1 family PASTA domain-containing Ser/Thr kinase [Peptostreptococcus sp. CBA3647]WAW14229.1 Stk1 family PASTA domain-containing Ser/Thr kinase [Peptostreptococcus sp. CBA3647]
MGATVLGNRYEILRKIGDGGMAFVYQAKDKLLNRVVAVKVLRPEFVDDQEFLVKFKREAEAVASLSHPNIVNVYDVGEDGKVHYIVMEYVDGQNLKEIIQEEGSLEEYTALDIAKQIAQALSAAHRNGIIHRDIKPHNILISKDGRQVKVADFGIAKAVSSSTMTNMGSVIGSVHYISPEQAKGKHLTSNADLYSLGIVLYEMIVGRVPFNGDSPISIALKHINENVGFTEEEVVRIPKSVRTIITKLTDKDPENRYLRAEDLIEDIEYVERNIDLSYMKDYDTFAKGNMSDRDLSYFYGRKPEINNEEDDDYYDDDYYDDYEDDAYYEDEYEDDIKTKKSKKDKKKAKKESPKARRRLKIIAVILILILLGYGVVAAKYFGFNPFGNHQSTEEAIVPNLVEMNVDQAQSALDEAGLKLVVQSRESSSKIPEGQIISQSPSPKTHLKKGDSVNVVVSSGASKVPVPNVIGLSLSQAEKLLNDNGLLLGNVKYEYNSAPEGTVLKQSLVGGSNEEGQKVSLIVSKGREKKVEEPSIIDDSENNNTDTNNSNTNSNTKPNTNNNNNNNNNTNPGDQITPGTGTGGNSGTTSGNTIDNN